MEDLLLEWHNNLPEIIPAMSLRDQAKYLEKKYDIKKHTFKVITPSTIPDGPPVETEEEEYIIKFKDIVCKYRPHLHLGDYWLRVRIVDGNMVYKFFSYINPEEGEPKLVDAVHPHFSCGIPCLGSFQGDLSSNFKENNFIQFFSVMKAYLQSYNGRSTYVRGNQFKKLKLKGELHSFNQVYEMFHTEEDHGDLDVVGIAKDPMRWNWPKEMTAFQSVVIEGQNPLLIKEYLNNSKYPILKTYSASLFNANNHGSGIEEVEKILGYVLAAHVIGELPIFKAFEFVRIFLTSLSLQYEGDMTPEVLTGLKAMAAEMYETRDSGTYKVNNRYTIRLDDEHREKVRNIWTGVKDYYVNPYSSQRESNKFGKHLKHLGYHLSNFIILLRKRTPELARGKTYLKKIKEGADLESVKQEHNKVKKYALGLALRQLEKDKRRFINELNRPEIENIIEADGQGTLFS